ncbi:response regulator [Niabella sp.]|uniref:response regulator transcription factor n=1 Tax=Niabella sp. TaxID=1962976 RepID=UPI0026017F58|nr:response regulator [Niabella sp.]
MKKDVLIIEDDDDIRYLIEYILKGALYEVRTGSSAKDLNDALAAKLPDIIILDIMLPDGNGIDLCKMIKGNGLTNHIPVIIMSAYQFSNVEEACAEAFINKPFGIHEVITAVKQVS